MTCDDYQLQASQYIDGELGDKDSGMLFEHLSGCSECRWFFRSTLEIRSEIQNDILIRQDIAGRHQPSRFTTAIALPFLVLLAAIVFFLGVSEISSPPGYAGPPSQQTEIGLDQPGAPGNPY